MPAISTALQWCLPESDTLSIKIMKKHLDVVAALFRKDGKILLCQRYDDDDFGGLWEFPGGKIEEGESSVQAVVREMKEELGLNCEVGNFVDKFSDENETLRIDIFLYRIDSYVGKMQCIECQDFKWVTLKESKTMNLAPADIKIVKYLMDRK